VVRIVDVDYSRNTIIVDNPLKWSIGQGVSLPYIGKVPDIGAFEFKSATTSLIYGKPKNVDLIDDKILKSPLNISVIAKQPLQKVDLLTIKGELVSHKRAEGQSKIDIGLKNLPAGLYVLRISKTGWMETRYIISLP
jgi:hypothetical protein